MHGKTLFARQIMLIMMCLLFFLIPLPAVAHKKKQPRILHLIAHNNTLELYLNYLLPKNGIARIWLTLFDTNRSRRLERNERQALGRHLGMRFNPNPKEAIEVSTG